MPRVGPQCLDFDAGGRPDVDPLKEAEFQQGMQAISRGQQPLEAVVYSQEHLCLPPSSPLNGVQEFRDNLKAVVVQALDSKMPGAYTIKEANESHAAKVLASTISPNAPSILPVVEPTLWYRLTASPYPNDTAVKGLAE
ncbi:hypothetical protein BS47DRAFT_1401478 [Hydnum rufescens UP504]|uniref:Uncharacterized protein n=1 Tax=Hydnum rufescens UP504 TaxID=1448309 RepID=A0A9P6AEQ7_9AGAM|nr:hypothetical protein BS47DRAFT_1401478 [Hydnum rufescens UP504]